jgi:hypothetical protein
LQLVHHWKAQAARRWLLFALAACLARSPSLAHADTEADVQKRKIDYGVMVTSYYMFNAHRVAGPYNDFQYPYADTHGFGLVFVGGGIRYEADRGGVMLQLRWGPNADRLTEFVPISRGFVRWTPAKRLLLGQTKKSSATLAGAKEADAALTERDRIKLDLGYFGAFIGIESADEWANATFSRGIVYFKIQPFRHLGLRASATPHEKVDVTLIVARGSIFGTAYPDDIDGRVTAPAVGAQIWFRPNSTTDLRLGTVTSPNGSDGNRNWQAVIDFIAIWKPEALALYVDADYQFSRQGPLTGLDASKQWGVSAGGRYNFADDWSVGLRGEYFDTDDDSATSLGRVFTVTATVRYSPIEYLIISLEPRAEFAQNDIYFSRPFTTDPATGQSVPSLNQDWFFGFWIGMTARLRN